MWLIHIGREIQYLHGIIHKSHPQEVARQNDKRKTWENSFMTLRLRRIAAFRLVVIMGLHIQSSGEGSVLRLERARVPTPVRELIFHMSQGS